MQAVLITPIVYAMMQCVFFMSPHARSVAAAVVLLCLRLFLFLCPGLACRSRGSVGWGGWY
jgi:hypothetical protein